MFSNHACRSGNEPATKTSYALPYDFWHVKEYGSFVVDLGEGGRGQRDFYSKQILVAVRVHTQ